MQISIMLTVKSCSQPHNVFYLQKCNGNTLSFQQLSLIGPVRTDKLCRAVFEIRRKWRKFWHSRPAIPVALPVTVKTKVSRVYFIEFIKLIDIIQKLMFVFIAVIAYRNKLSILYLSKMKEH